MARRRDREEDRGERGDDSSERERRAPFRPRSRRYDIDASMSAGMSVVSSRIATDAAPKPEHRSERREHQRFGHELAQQASGRCAEGGADGQLARPALRAHQQQACDVDAGDDQQQGRSPEQHQQERADVAGNHFREGHERRALPAVRVRIDLLEAGGDRHHVGGGGLDRHPILQAGDAVQRVAAAPQVALALRVEGRPEVGRLGGSEVEVARQHADDHVGLSVERHGTADRVGPAAIPVLPCRVAQDDDARPGRQVFAGAEVAAEDGVAHRGCGRTRPRRALPARARCRPAPAA